MRRGGGRARRECDVTASRPLSTYTFRAVHHVYTTGHLTELLDEGGFVVVGRFADPDGTPFTVGAGRLLLVTERR